MIESSQRIRGDVTAILSYEDGTTETKHFRNIVLNSGKSEIVNVLAGNIGSSFLSYICKMVFGNNGTVGGVPKFVDASRTGLFGPAVISKNVIATIDPSNPTQVVFSAILTGDDAVGISLSEMALQMADGTYYSMVSFGDIAKTSLIQITWLWTISLL